MERVEGRLAAAGINESSITIGHSLRKEGTTMSQVKPAIQHDYSATAAARSSQAFDAGGEVGLLQSEIARRLGVVDPTPSFAPRLPSEQALRYMSVASGYIALACGIVVAAVAIF